MKNLACFRDFEISPLAGHFDARSQSGEVDFFDYRMVLNIAQVAQKKKCRLGGWQKLLADSPFGFLNQDFHDQLIGCQFYYESLSHSFFYPRVLSGYNYPYFWPSQNWPSSQMDVVSSQSYYGYWPEFVDNPYPKTVEEDIWRICLERDGFPYTFVQNYAVPNTGNPYFYEYPYFHLCFFTAEDGYSLQGYGYGESIGVYSNPYIREYEYCGNFLYDRSGCREAVTFLYEAVSISGRRQLLVGTKSRIALLNEKTGNYRLLADGLGGLYQQDDNCSCSARRFKAAQLGNTITFVNDFDPVMFWNMDTGPGGCNFWSAEFIPDLQGLGITRARAVAQFKGFMFIGNVSVEGEAQPSRLFWSDYNQPLSYAPGGESVAGTHEFGRGEKIIAIEPLAGSMRIYTSRGKEKVIYEAILVGGDEVWNFPEIYRGPDGIEFPNSLVNIGHAHLFFGVAGLMWLGEYDRTPTRPEWIHKATGVFYSGVDSKWVESFSGLNGFGAVNRNECEQVVGGYDSELKNIWFSWPTDANVCPNMSLLLNEVYGHASLVDHGFTAFLTYRPDYRLALREFLAVYGGCDIGLEHKEGVPYIDFALGTMPAYLRNPTENPDLPVHADSFCARVSGLQLEDLCGICEANTVFIMADAQDRTLKEFTPSQYLREQYVDPFYSYECPCVVPGTYVDNGYASMMQGDAFKYGTNVEKLINKALVDFDADVQTTPGLLNFQVAYGAQPGCMVWETADPVEFSCIVDYNEASAEAVNERPGEIPSFLVYRRGAYLGWRFWIEGLGAGGCFNGVNLSVRKASGDWK